MSHLGIRHQGAGFSFSTFFLAKFFAFLKVRFSVSISGVLSSLAAKKREWDRWIGRGVNTVVGLLLFFFTYHRLRGPSFPIFSPHYIYTPRSTFYFLLRAPLYWYRPQSFADFLYSTTFIRQSVRSPCTSTFSYVYPFCWRLVGGEGIIPEKWGGWLRVSCYCSLFIYFFFRFNCKFEIERAF